MLADGFTGDGFHESGEFYEKAQRDYRGRSEERQ